MISRDRIKVTEQPRRAFPKAERDELARSIRELHARNAGIEGTGILLPLLVLPDEGDGYPLIAGQRRYMAAGDALIDQVPAIVVPARTDAVLLMQLIENMQRQALTPLEEAKGIQNLMAEQHLSYRDVAKLIGKDRGYVENRLNLLKAGEDVQELVSLRNDTLSHALIIAKVEDTKLRKQLIDAVLNEDASVAELRRRIERKTAAKPIAGDNIPTTPLQHEPTNGEIDNVKEVHPSTGEQHYLYPHEPEAHPSAPQMDPLRNLQEGNRLWSVAADTLEQGMTTEFYERRITREISLMREQIGRLEALRDRTLSEDRDTH